MDPRLIQKLAKNLQTKRNEVQKKLNEIKEKEYVISTGNDLVRIRMNGAFEMISCDIDERILGDKETIEDLIITAVNEIIKKIEGEVKEVESSLMSIPGMPF